jgi:hypothetical protein
MIRDEGTNMGSDCLISCRSFADRLQIVASKKLSLVLQAKKDKVSREPPIKINLKTTANIFNSL